MGFEDGAEDEEDHKDDEEEYAGFDVPFFFDELQGLHSIEGLEF